MDGAVITISPDATVDERTGESHYTVRVRTFADTLRDRDGRKLLIGPGMTADVNLLGTSARFLLICSRHSRVCRRMHSANNQPKAVEANERDVRARVQRKTAPS